MWKVPKSTEMAIADISAGSEPLIWGEGEEDDGEGGLRNDQPELPDCQLNNNRRCAHFGLAVPPPPCRPDEAGKRQTLRLLG